MLAESGSCVYVVEKSTIIVNTKHSCHTVSELHLAANITKHPAIIIHMYTKTNRASKKYTVKISIQREI